MNKTIISLLFLNISLIYAHDWGENEGIIENQTGTNSYCYKDLDYTDCIKRTPLFNHQLCVGDAMGIHGFVFKVPNRVSFVCFKQECVPKDLTSSLIYAAAMVKNGVGAYGLMSFEQFKIVMGNKELCR